MTMRFFDCGPAVSEMASVSADPSDAALAWLMGAGGAHTGIACKFAVDDDPEREWGGEASGGRRGRLVEYLSSRSLHVDVWDGDSLMHIGSVSVPLVGALRQVPPTRDLHISPDAPNLPLVSPRSRLAALSYCPSSSAHKQSLHHG